MRNLAKALAKEGGVARYLRDCPPKTSKALRELAKDQSKGQLKDLLRTILTQAAGKSPTETPQRNEPNRLGPEAPKSPPKPDIDAPPVKGKLP